MSDFSKVLTVRSNLAMHLSDIPFAIRQPIRRPRLLERVYKHLHLCTSPEERLYNTVKGSAQATQVVLAHTMAQCNPTVERGLAKQPRIKKLPKGQAADKLTQTKEKDKSQ